MLIYGSRSQAASWPKMVACAPAIGFVFERVKILPSPFRDMSQELHKALLLELFIIPDLGIRKGMLGCKRKTISVKTNIFHHCDI